MPLGIDDVQVRYISHDLGIDLGRLWFALRRLGSGRRSNARLSHFGDRPQRLGARPVGHVVRIFRGCLDIKEVGTDGLTGFIGLFCLSKYLGCRLLGSQANRCKGHRDRQPYDSRYLHLETFDEARGLDVQGNRFLQRAGPLRSRFRNTLENNEHLYQSSERKQPVGDFYVFEEGRSEPDFLSRLLTVAAKRSVANLEPPDCR